ncbi:MAG: cation:proton antiporter, partial [Corallococcus sp.]|nr:cation:proton antiporter [Corallococcus sp.]
FALSDLLVCMMAGATFVNMRKEAPQMMEGTDRWTPVVLMLFFILSGAELDLKMFFEDPIVLVCILIYIVARCCGKYFGTVAGAAITKSDKNVRRYLGITLFPQAGVAIGMAHMCYKEFEKAGMPDIGKKIVTITMCAVMIYELVGPVLTKWALTKAGEIDPANLRQSRRSKKQLAVDVANGAYETVVTNENQTSDTSVQTSEQVETEEMVSDD